MPDQNEFLNCTKSYLFFPGHAHHLEDQLHRDIIVLFGSWGLQATKLWNLWNLSHFTYTSLPTEGERNTSSVAGACSGLAIAESFESYRL